MYGLIVDQDQTPYIYGSRRQMERQARAEQRRGHETRLVVLGENVCDSCGRTFPRVETVYEDLGQYCGWDCRDEAQESARADSLEDA